MAELERATHAGRLRIVGAQPELLAAAAELVLADTPPERHAQPPIGKFVAFAGARAYLKKTSLRGKARARYALKALCGMRLPCVREHDNLRWLRARLFQAPEPLAAGVCWRGAMPAFQFLLTREVPQARTLDAFLAASTPAAREAVLDELAREVARMHALGFVHHDLFPRNLLVTEGNLQRVWFIDCWAGGTPPRMRGPAYDLACLTLRAELFTPAEVQRLFELYLSERRAQDRPVQLHALAAATQRARARLARRTARGPAPTPPPLPWPRS